MGRYWHDNDQGSEDAVPTLLVFLKYPVAGKVKTRLAQSIGAERAANLYRQWLGQVLASIQPLRGRMRIVACYDGAPQSSFTPWDSLADEWWPQPEGDLGGRLHVAFDKAHKSGEPVIAIGTDCLELDALAFQQALDLLTVKDVVFGPATDGGYYLVGTARPLPDFFRGIPWSSPETLAAHRALCRDRGWSVGLLPTRRDIDTWEDWLSHCRTHEATLTNRADELRMAVVIPTLDEEARLATTLRSIRDQGDEADQIFVADGGSTDGTQALAEKYGAKVIVSPRRGRGCQIAAAVAQLQEEIVLVVHADMTVPAGALA